MGAGWNLQISIMILTQVFYLGEMRQLITEIQAQKKDKTQKKVPVWCGEEVPVMYALSKKLLTTILWLRQSLTMVTINMAVQSLYQGQGTGNGTGVRTADIQDHF